MCGLRRGKSTSSHPARRSTSIWMTWHFPQRCRPHPQANYQAQVFLDVDHSYAYSGPGPGDLFSEPKTLASLTPAGAETLDLIVGAEMPAPPAPVPPANVKPLDVHSAVLSAFWGRPMAVRGYVVLPPHYDARTKYPTVSWTHGFGGTLTDIATAGIPEYQQASSREDNSADDLGVAR